MNRELLAEGQLLWEVTFKTKTRLRGPVSCGSSTLNCMLTREEWSQLDRDYSYSVVRKKEFFDIEEETYTLSVDGDRHQFVSDGIISKNTAADIFRIAFVNMHKKFFKVYPEYVQFRKVIHDEIDFVLSRQRTDLLDTAVDIMTLKRPDWEVPMEVGVEVGTNWGNMVAFIKENGEWVPKKK